MKKMKKHIIILAAIFAAALLTPACSPEEVQGLKGEGLTISLFSDELETKAYNPTMDDAIDHFDFYFFENVGGTTPISGMHGRVTGSSSVTLDTRPGQTYEALRKRESFVYIIANYPGSHPTTDHMTLSELLALPVDYKIVTAKATEVNPITGKEEETGDVTFNPNLVMDSYNATTGKHTVQIAAPTKFNEARTVNVGLTRLAAKLTLTVNVANEAAGSMENEKWTPVLADLKAYFVNALNNKTTVAGTPIRRSDPTTTTDYEYLTYPTPYPLTVDENNDHTFTSDPVFTYPQTWASDENGDPYFKIQIPWMSNFRGTSNFYYKVRVPRVATNGLCTLERNKHYKVTVNLSAIDTENEYVELNATYVVEPWGVSSWTGGNNMSVARFFNVPRMRYELDNITSVAVPYYSSSAIKAYLKQVTYSYYGASNGVLATYEFNNSDETKTTWTLPTTDSNGNSVAESAQDANQYSLTWDSKNVTFTHPLSNIYTEIKTTFVIDNNDPDPNKHEIAEVTVVQHPAIEIKTHETVNGFVNGRFARATADVQDADGNKMGVGPYTTSHFGVGSYYHSTEGWYENHNTSAHGYKRIGEDASAFGSLGIIFGDCSTSVNADCLFITEVTVNAFDPSTGTDGYTIVYTGDGAGTYDRHFRVGDPRVPAGTRFSGSKALPDYLYSDKTHRSGADPIVDPVTNEPIDDTRAWEEPMKILIANQDASANEVIAPRFLVSSNFNNMSSWPLSNENCVRRAATYQEDGYPAGRWRLPTEAEINFMMTLQQKGIIPQLYAFGSSYQCANKRAVKIESSGARTCVNPTSAYHRLVYDLWYWGDDPDRDKNVYHPNMHEH